MSERRTVKVADLVNASEVARRLGVSRAAVSNWHVRHPKFPKPVVGTAVYRWPEIEKWAGTRNSRHVRHMEIVRAATEALLFIESLPDSWFDSGDKAAVEDGLRIALSGTKP